MKIIEKKKVSQQLVEFLLVVPFMVIILGILTEYAYALNVNMTLVQGLKAVTSSYCTKDSSGTDQCYGIYDQISPTNDKDAIKTIVTNGFDQYLKDNNVPNQPENNRTVNYLTVGQTAIFYVKYTYIPAFTLPNVYFKFLPDKFDFFATVAVPAAFLGDNSAYIGGVDSLTLDKIWSSIADFSTEDSFDASKQGIIKAQEPGDVGGGRASFHFLIPNPELNGSSTPIEGDGPLAQPLELVTWGGSITYTAVDMASGELYTWCRGKRWIPQTCSNADGTSYDCSYWYYFIVTTDTHQRYSPSGQTVFVHDPQIPDVNSLGNWNPSGATDLSPTSVSCALKRMVTLTDTNNLSIGSYEPSINVAAYNLSVLGGAQYQVKYSGSNKLIYTAVDNIGILGW